MKFPQLQIVIADPGQAHPLAVGDRASVSSGRHRGHVGLNPGRHVGQVQDAGQIGRVHAKFSGQRQPFKAKRTVQLVF